MSGTTPALGMSVTQQNPPDGTTVGTPPPEAATPPASPTSGSTPNAAPAAGDQGTGEGQPSDGKPKRSIVDDLRGERQRRQEAERRAQELEQRYQQVQPLVDAIAADPTLLQLVTQRLSGGQPAAPQGPSPQEVQQLTEFAQYLGLYDARGNPDLAAAQRVAAIIDARAQAAAQQATAPVQQTVVAGQAATVKQALIQAAAQQGISAETIEQVAGLLPPHLLVEPGVPQLVLMVAAGKERFDGTARPPAEEPLYVETAGGRRAVAPLPANLQGVLRQHGLSDQDIAQAAAYQGGPARLE